MNDPFFVESVIGHIKSPIHLAAGYGDLDQLQQLLDSGVDVDDDSEWGTPLSIAAYCNQPEVCRWLIERGASPDARDRDSDPPLLAAMTYGQADAVRVLIDCGADVNLYPERSSPPLLEALCRYEDRAADYSEIIQMLMQAGADPNLADSGENRGYTSLMAATRLQKLDLVQMLVQVGGDVNQRSQMGDAALNIARRYGASEIAAFLESCGAVEPMDIHTNLHVAILWNDTEAVAKLLQTDCDVNQWDVAGRTPLLITACDWGNREIAKMLLQRGADPNLGFAPDASYHSQFSGKTPLISACWQQYPDLVKLLLDFGANLDLFEHGFTPLIVAIWTREYEPKRDDQKATEVMRILIDYGANVNYVGKFEGLTALHYAVTSGNVSAVTLLLERGADVDSCYRNEYGFSGHTALMDAAESGSLEIVKLLLDHGADVNHQNADGVSPALSAVSGSAWNECPRHEMLDLLVSYGADLGLRDSKGWSALGKAQE